MNIALDNLLSGLLGAVIGSLLTIAHNRSEIRRAERLVVAERVHDALTGHAMNTVAYSAGVAARDLNALVDLQPLRGRRGVRRRVQAYRAACQQQTREDELGGVLNTNPRLLDEAIAALLPDTVYR